MELRLPYRLTFLHGTARTVGEASSRQAQTLLNRLNSKPLLPIVLASTGITFLQI